MSEPKLSPEHKKVLAALAASPAPLANKQIADAAGLDGKAVTALVGELKGLGLLGSPARCKYGLTAAGKNAVG